MGEGSGPNNVHDAFVPDDSDVCGLLRSRHREALVFNKCGSVYVGSYIKRTSTGMAFGASLNGFTWIAARARKPCAPSDKDLAKNG